MGGDRATLISVKLLLVSAIFNEQENLFHIAQLEGNNCLDSI